MFFDALPETIGLHAITAGAIDTLTTGMMARVALGHTGRPLVAPLIPVVYAPILIAPRADGKAG